MDVVGGTQIILVLVFRAGDEVDCEAALLVEKEVVAAEGVVFTEATGTTNTVEIVVIAGPVLVEMGVGFFSQDFVLGS